MDCAVYLINFIFIRQNHNEGITRSIGVKYVVCSPTEVVLKVLSSTVWRSAHSLRRKNFTKNLISTTSACYIWILKPDLYFSIGKITTLTAALMHSFRVWYVQCLAKRLTLNLIEFIHLKVGRSFDSLAVKNFMKNWTTTKSAARFAKSNGFRFWKLFSGNADRPCKRNTRLCTGNCRWNMRVWIETRIWH